MSKRLPAVLELPESCSESSSPGHKRSRTQQKSRNCALVSNEQVWQIIQSRRNLDKKVRKVQSRIKTSQDSKSIPVLTPSQSPTFTSISSSEIFKKILDKKKIEIKRQREISQEKNKENREKIREKGKNARLEVKSQGAIDLEWIKKRDEEIRIRKQEIVKRVKMETKTALEKRKVCSRTFREVNSSEFLNRIQKIQDMNRAAEDSIRILEEKQEEFVESVRSKSVLKLKCSSMCLSYSNSAASSPRSDVY